MSMYFGTTEITNFDNLAPAQGLDITGLYFGDKECFTVWSTYDGTLPAQYSANGSALADYRIYGAAGGVGDRTENLAWTGWAEDAVSREMGTISTVDGRSAFSFSAAAGYPNYDDNKWIFSTTWATNTQYTISFDYRRSSSQSANMIMQARYTDNTYDVFNNCVNDGNWNAYVFTTAANKTVKNICAYYTSGGLSIDIDTFMVNEGSTAPAEYVPYGYAIPMFVSDGTTSTTTPIYIGDTPLGEDEYVDYGKGKVYRRTENKLDGNLITNEYPGSAWGKIQYILKPNTSYVLCTSAPRYGGSALLAIIGSSGSATTANNGAWDSNPRVWETDSTGIINVLFRGNNSGYDLTQYDYMLTEGSTAPAEYIPYLQPTDPPVPLPALPTVDGTNIVDYAGQSAAVPSRFVAKYRKEGF